MALFNTYIHICIYFCDIFSFRCVFSDGKKRLSFCWWCQYLRSFPFLYVTVLGSAEIELIFTTSWLGWPKQPIKWDVLYHVMSSSLFKWVTGSRRGFCYSGARWLGGENTARCICFDQYYCFLLPLPFCETVLTPTHKFLPVFLWILLPIPSGRGKEWESNCVVLLLKIEARPQQWHKCIWFSISYYVHGCSLT